jgi:hypothetical protein
MGRDATTIDPDAWASDGFVVVRGLLDARTVTALQAATDVLEAAGAAFVESTAVGKVFYEVQSASGRKREPAVFPGAFRKITGPSKSTGPGGAAFARVRAGCSRRRRRHGAGLRAPRCVVDQVNFKHPRVGTPLSVPPGRGLPARRREAGPAALWRRQRRRRPRRRRRRKRRLHRAGWHTLAGRARWPAWLRHVDDGRGPLRHVTAGDAVATARRRGVLPPPPRPRQRAQPLRPSTSSGDAVVRRRRLSRCPPDAAMVTCHRSDMDMPPEPAPPEPLPLAVPTAQGRRRQQPRRRSRLTRTPRAEKRDARTKRASTSKQARAQLRRGPSGA